MAPAGLAIGTVLGAGAYTRTWQAVGPRGALVLKRLIARGAADPDGRRAFADEVAVLARLGGRGAPRLLEHGEDEDGPWLTMERVSGRPLSPAPDVGPSSAPAPAARGAWLGRVAESAFSELATVHAGGVLHGDLAPPNVLVDDAGGARLVDFGLARFDGMQRSPSGAFRGTIAYAAPEVARGEPWDARADLFALAVSLLAAASGTTPRAGAAAALLLRAAEDPIDAWAIAAARALPERVGRALVACTAFAPEGRPRRADRVFSLDPW